MPATMMIWFESCGLFTNCQQRTRLNTNASFENLLKANLKHQQVNYVCLLLRASILAPSGGQLAIDKLRKDTPKTLSPTPDHWVVQKSGIYIGNRPAPHGDHDQAEDLKSLPMSFRVASWGVQGGLDVRTRVRGLTPNQFLPYYNGFVSAQPRGL